MDYVLQKNYSFISRINLTNFRNYKVSEFHFSNSPVVIFGENGLGKTNILEAISFLSPGAGLRSANLADVIYNKNNEQIPVSNLIPGTLLWSLHAKISGNENISSIGTALTTTSTNRNKRIVKIDNELSKDQASLGKFLNIIWLTPQMDSLFIDSSSDRRNFLDRTVYALDPTHSTRINNYKKNIHERMVLLISGQKDEKWLEVLEKKITELAIEIAAARNETVMHLNSALKLSNSAFLTASVTIDGYLENLVINEGASKAQELFLQKLFENRIIDAKMNRTNVGVHRSDLKVFHKEKGIEAKFCSTGEQKLLLISLTLAKAKMSEMLKKMPSILLLDEIVSHLDYEKKLELFKEISKINGQCFLTGTEKEIFSELNEISDSSVEFLDIKKIITEQN